MGDSKTKIKADSKAKSIADSKGKLKSDSKLRIKAEKSEVIFKPVPYKCHVRDDPDGNQPDFIYGGPFFVPLKKLDRLMDMMTPTNVAHSGTYKRYSGPQLLLHKLFVENCLLRFLNHCFKI